MSHLFGALREGLRELNYLEGQNLLIEARWAENRIDRLPDLAQELVKLSPEVIVTQAPPTTLAMKAVTSTIPIVAVSVSDPVGMGLAASLARPGGNVTGLTLASTEHAAKRLELLKEVAPGISRVAIFYLPDNPTDRANLTVAQRVAPALNLTVLPMAVSVPADFASAFAQAIAQGANSASFHAGTLASCCLPEIVDFTLQHRIPAIHNGRPQGPDVGGLMSYGSDPADNYRRAAGLVDKILKGTKPGDIPIENPTRFEFVINLKAAQTLGLTIPPSVLAQATDIIQ